MAIPIRQCLVCGRDFKVQESEEMLPYFCSLGCQFDAGPVGTQMQRLTLKRGRAAKVARSVMDVESAVPQTPVGVEDDGE